MPTRLAQGMASVLCSLLLLAACGGSTSTPNVNTSSAAQSFQPIGGATCRSSSIRLPSGLELKSAVVGFSQSEALSNPFRSTESASVQQAATAAGVKQYKTTVANGDPAKQLSDIEDLLSGGVQILIVAPLNATGLEPALQQAAQKNVPVFLIDRTTAGAACRPIETFIASDFVKQGAEAADLLAQATNGTARVAILQGSIGSSVEVDRTRGFVDRAQAAIPGFTTVAKQSGNFTRADGQRVMEQLIQAHPDISAVYAENDEMALGAIQALQAAGRTPGKDVQVVSIDGTRAAVQAVIDGSIHGDIETNPRFGTLTFQVIRSFLNGDSIPQRIAIQDQTYTKANARQALTTTAY